MQNFGITKNMFKEFLVEKLSTKKEYDKMRSDLLKNPF